MHSPGEQAEGWKRPSSSSWGTAGCDWPARTRTTHSGRRPRHPAGSRYSGSRSHIFHVRRSTDMPEQATRQTVATCRRRTTRSDLGGRRPDRPPALPPHTRAPRKHARQPRPAHADSRLLEEASSGSGPPKRDDAPEGEPEGQNGLCHLQVSFKLRGVSACPGCAVDPLEPPSPVPTSHSYLTGPNTGLAWQGALIAGVLVCWRACCLGC